MGKPQEPAIVYEGPCAYAVAQHDGTCRVMVHSSNMVTHIEVALLPGDVAETTCRRLNAYPRNTRRAYGLL